MNGIRVVSGVFTIPFDIRSSAFRLRKGNRLPPLLREYIAGEENLLVRRVFRALSEDRSYCNPIVLYGAPGTGKSMLARSLACAGIQLRSNSQAFVIPAADFVRDYATAVDTDSVGDFRSKLRKAAVLVIDDIHHLADRAAAQNELCRLLDDALARNRLFIATSAYAPMEAPRICSGLASRLAGGLVVPVAPPGPEARRVILQRLGQRCEASLPDVVIERIARAPSETGTATVQQLNNVIQRLVTISQQEGRDIDEELTRECLGQRSRASKRNLQTIAREVAKYFQLRVAELRGATRQRRVVRARGVAMLLARKITRKSLKEIGEYFGGRDHTTVLHACRKTEKLTETDGAIRQAMESLNQRLAAK